MMRIINFVLQIAAVAALAIWLADRPGTAHIVWHDTVIETSAAFLGLCALAFAYALHLLLRLWHFLRHGPVHWRLRRKLNKVRQGQDQLTQGLVAIASGNAIEAGRLAVASRKNNGDSAAASAAAQWLQAQAAQMAGDAKTARAIFRALAADSETAILGYRGLITEARQAGEWQEVDRLVDELHRLKPATPWLSLIRSESAARRGQWGEAESALSHATAARLTDSAAGRRTRAALRIALAREAIAGGDTDAALRASEQAAQQAPDWLPAIINLAETLAAAQHNRAARRVVERAWATTPHPQLAQILRRMSGNTLDAYKQTEHMCRANETVPQSRLALAEAALAADIWGEARRHLLASVKDNQATQETYKLLARLERRERGDERAAAAWLTKMAEAAHDATWICSSCDGAHAAWQPTCFHCGAFNALEWRHAGQSRKSVLSLTKEGDPYD